MRMFWKIISNRHFLPLFFVIIFAVLAGRSLIFQSGYFNMHDDLQLMRQLQMEKCFLDGQVPCRWVPDMGYGYGFPLFNFYPPLPYLIGQLFRVVGFSFIETAKLTFAMSFIASGVAMYLLAKEFFGKVGGVLSAVFYIWAPYHAVDVYVRGAMNESWALVWFPLILWSGYRLVKEVDKSAEKVKNEQSFNFINILKSKSLFWVILLSLSWFSLLTSHNLMVLIFAPVFAVWIIFHWWQTGSLRSIFYLAVSGIWSLGLAAFFTLPALVENKFTHIMSTLVGYYDYTAHFVDINQLLFSRFWGYGPSVWGSEDDGMPFQVGHLHWILSLVVALLLLIIMWKNRKNIISFLKDQRIAVALIFLVVGWFSAFLAHSRSTPVWLSVDQLKYLQFPWRFLALNVFAFSFVVGAIPAILSISDRKSNIVLKILSANIKVLLSLLMIIPLLLLNWNYFRPEKGRMGKLTDEEKLSNAAWELQQTAGIYDYLPVTAKTAPRGPQETTAEIIDGNGSISNEEQGTDWANFSIDVADDEALVRINTFYFPEWKVFADGREVEVFIPDNEDYGRMHVNLSRGSYEVNAKLFDTPVRSVSNLVSLFSWIALLGVVIFRKLKTTPNLK